MEAINLNLIPNGTNPVVHCSQYDEGREFRFNLFDGASVFVLDGTEVITCDIKKPDGNIVTAAVPNTEDDYIIVTTTLQMTACSGNSLGTINISKDGINLYTLNFVLYCERSPLENGIESESSIHDLQTQIGEAVAEQYDAEAVVFDAVPTQGHGTGFAVTSEGVKNAIGGLSIPDELNDLADVAITTPSNGEILVYNNGSWENQANPASTTNFAPDYDDTATYNTNDKVIYQGLLYVCLEDSVTGAWDGTKWQQISVADLNAELLPIQSGSATNTKDYIDNKVVGTYSQTNLAPQSGVTINDGGYCVIGNIVIVNIRFTLSSNKLSGSSLIHGFPSPIATANNISCSNSGKINMPMNTSGQIIIGEDLGSGTYIASCVYLKI